MNVGAAAIELRNLHYSYEDTKRAVHVLRGVTLQIERGSIFGLLGPNGAGKSTTFKVVVGLAKPSSGEALVNGMATYAGSREIYTTVGYMPDLSEVFDDITLEGLLRFFGRCQGLDERRIARRIDELLKQFHLESRRNDYLRTMSKGLRQQAHLMRCLIHEPDILLLDEPASHLDPIRRQLLLEVLRNENTKGRTIVISSHILPELSDLCTSLALMKNGQIVDHGRVDELKRKHQNPFATYSVRVLDNSTNAVRLLERIQDPCIAGISRRDDRTLHLEYAGTEEQLVNLIQLMVVGGIRMGEFYRIYKDIEQIYRETIAGWGDSDE